MKKRKYVYRDGRKHKVSANVAAPIFARLKKEGRFNAVGVVDEARSEDSPLHPEFDWDVNKAAEAHWRDHARQWIADFVPVEWTGLEPGPPTEIAFVSVSDSEGNRGWTDTVSALSDEATEAQLEKEALAILEGWLRRFSYLPGLSRVVSAIRKFLEKREAA